MKDTLPNRARFGGFELDLKAGELHKDGQTVLLQEQPLQVLRMLVLNAGELVTREEIQRKLWPNNTVVEFDHGINTAIQKLRQALGDSANKPSYIQTVARRGYRFLVPVEWRRIEDDSSGPDSPVADSAQFLEPKSVVDRSAANLVGKRVSHYRVLEVLGGGGMGVVYKAEDVKLGRQVALKFLPGELAWDEVALKRFQREAKTASSLDHPNICTIYEVEEHDGQPFIVMQLQQGETLRDRLAALAGEQKKLPLNELLEIAIQICDGLQAAHEKGIIHRDIKPANIFLTSSGQVKILDFGVAKFASVAHETAVDGVKLEGGTGTTLPVISGRSEDIELTRLGAAVGTWRYMSPEQIRGERLDARTDLFSLGAVLYEMATCKMAFSGDTVAIVEELILNGAPIPLACVNPDVSPALEHIVNKALEKERKRRYQSAAELRTDLHALKRELDLGRVPATTIQIGSRAVANSRFRWMPALLFSFFGLLVLTIAILWVNLQSPLPKVVNSMPITMDGKVSASRLISNGTQLYFQSSAGGTRDLVRVSAQGGETVPMQLPLQEPQAYDISPSGVELLVGGGEFKGGNPERPLWIVPLPTGPPHRVGDILAHGACWAPDGHHLVFVNEKDLFVAEPDGGNVRKLATADGAASWIRFSPDGARLRFTVLRGSADPDKQDIMEITADGSGLHRLPIHGCCGTWSTDGRYYFYQRDRDIWVLPERRSILGEIELGTPLPLTTGPISFMMPAPGPNGKQLFAVGTQLLAEMVHYESRSNQFVSFLGGISAEQPEVSPDGQWVVYRTYPEGNLWRSRLDGSQRLQLTFAPLDAQEPRWSPDGRRILFTDVLADVPSKIFVIPAEGGVPQQLMPEDHPNSIGAGAWLPDGNRIVFTRGMGCPGGGIGAAEDASCWKKNIAIYLLDLRTQQVSKLPGSDKMFSSRVSPDGRFVTGLLTDRSKLMLYDFQMEKWSALAQGVSGATAWSHDSKFVYVVRRVAERAELVRIRIPDGKIEHVLDLGDTILVGYFPDWVSLLTDDSLVLAREKITQDIYRLDLGYR